MEKMEASVPLFNHASINKENIEALVQQFNNLQRPQKRSYGSDDAKENGWYFSIRNVPVEPRACGFLLLSSLDGNRHYPVGPLVGSPSSLETPEAKADLVIPHLLKTFVEGPSVDRIPLTPKAPLPAPSKWATKDVELARAMEERLKTLGVVSELCTIHPGTSAEHRNADERWTVYLESIMRSMGIAMEGVVQNQNVLAACRRAGNQDCEATDNPSAPLHPCKKCQIILYCSKKCRTKDRDFGGHKNMCRKGASAFESNDYYCRVAQTSLEARQLADSMNLLLPGSGGERLNVDYPIRRLVTTGRDTPQNIALLLGPNWRRTEGSKVKDVRIQVLLDPPLGSTIMAMNKQYDVGGPLPHTPRPASPEEAITIRKVRDMQAAVSKHLGDRKTPTPQDMLDILAQQEMTQELLQIYNWAIYSMDQGIETVYIDTMDQG